MNKPWLRLVAVVSSCLLALGLVIVLTHAAPETAPLSFDGRYFKRLKKQRPDVVLIGNSMVYTRFEEGLLNELVGPTRVAIVSIGASKPAVWYAQLKHSVVASGARPRRVLIFFRGRELTSRTNTEGRDSERLQRATRGRDPVIERKLAARRKESPDPLRDALGRIASVESLRATMWERVDGLALDLSETLVDGPSGEPRKKAINALFGVQSLRSEAESSTEVEEKGSTFSRHVARSFLPEIFQLARENGIALTFLRIRTRRHAAGIPDTPEQARYQASLRAYLEGEGARYLDLTTTEWETVNLYGSGDHIAPRHRPDYVRRFVRDHPELFRESP